MKTILLDLLQPVKDIYITEDCEIYAYFAGKNTAAIKQNFRIIHQQPGLKSRILIKAVLKDQSQMELAPLLVMEKGAKLCDSYLKIAVLLLGKAARAKAIPSLEIHENDVKAGHGAAIGKPEPEQLWYLQSRGLSRDEAEALLIEAFTADLPASLLINK